MEQIAYIVLGSALAMAGSIVTNDAAIRRALRRETRAAIYRDILPRLYAPDNPSWNTPPLARRVSGSARVPVGELQHLVELLPSSDQRYGEQLGSLLERLEETARQRPEVEGRQEELDRLTTAFFKVVDDFAAHLAERLRGGRWWRGQ